MWRFLVVDNSDGTVRGTDSEEVAHSYVGPDDFYVIDLNEGQMLLYRDGMGDIAELEVFEVRTALHQEEAEEDGGEDDDPTAQDEADGPVSDDPEDSRN